MKSAIYNRVFNRRKELGLTQDDLAKIAKTSRVTISHIELGISTNLRATTLFSLAKGLNCDPEWLLTGKISRTTQTLNPHVQLAPLLNLEQLKINKYPPHKIDISDTETLPCPVAASENTFALKIAGESMDLRFEEDDIIFVDPSLIPTPGAFVIVMQPVQQTATLMQFQILNGEQILKELNPKHPPCMCCIKTADEFSILGVVISHIKSV